ncbi:DUF2637 domain-containing protein [Catenulispora sp. NL8]|uniref:DUF2637 domain-containing protein n=1 Tax=Catenulispora pinistramenti TaxID=2705254 RepID=A0ABS5KUC7_9ACTN|nr:DUF2637 domain-containing protein [Catenulispora pinistramenti]MBS2549642.1 DUF2637 domain-containing protein [Catenulispora pinistramenti]
MSPKRIARALVLAGIGIVILAAGILSFSALRRLGIAAGWTPGLAALLPVSIDVYALISTVSWLVLAEGEADRRRSGINASVAVCLSVVGNGIEHLNAFHVLTVGWPVVIAVSAVPPVVMALSVHLAVRFLAETEEAQTVPAVAAETVTDDGENGPERAVKGGWKTLPEPVKISRAKAATERLKAEGTPVTGASLAGMLGTTDRTGRNYLAKLNAA